MDESHVEVPIALLAGRLDMAETNLWQVHGEFCAYSDKDADGRHCCDKDRDDIDALRRAAGIGGGDDG